MLNPKFILSVVVCWFISAPLHCQKSYDFDSLLQHNPYFEPVLKAVADTFRLFEQTDPLEFNVSTDFKHLLRNKHKDEYQQATITYQLGDTLSLTREVRIKPRGEFRLKECQYPPLRVNVKQTKAVFAVLDQLDKLKMVVPCKGYGKYQAYIFNEYLAYRLYQVVTDFSFGIRLIKVNYQNTGGKLEVGSAYTFIIESHQSLAERLESIPIKNKKLGARNMQQEHAVIMYLFQYMIGNTDWSVSGLHNIKLIKANTPSIPYPIPIPYDFDYSGLVDASYAIPREELNIPNVRVRKYLGSCTTEEELNRGINYFQEKKGEIMALLNEFPWLTEKEKSISQDYIEDFYKILDDPKKVRSQISRACVP